MPDAGEPVIYLAPQEMRSVLHRDRVRVRIQRLDRKGRRHRQGGQCDQAPSAPHRIPASQALKRVHGEYDVALPPEPQLSPHPAFDLLHPTL